MVDRNSLKILIRKIDFQSKGLVLKLYLWAEISEQPENGLS